MELNAFKDGNLPVVQQLVRRYNGVDLEEGLAFACIQGHTEVVKCIMENFPGVEFKDALKFAAFNGHLSIVQYLIKSEFTWRQPKYSAANLFNLAVHNGQMGVASWLYYKHQLKDVYSFNYVLVLEFNKKFKVTLTGLMQEITPLPSEICSMIVSFLPF